MCTGWSGAGRGCFLQATPIEVADIVAEKLFSKIDTVVLTSATLAVSGGFEYVQKRLGVANPRTLVVPGHFDYQKQALFYVPQHLPEPRSPAFTAKASEEVLQILAHSRGRAFVLFTSYQQMRLVYEKVSLELRVSHPAAGHWTAPRAARRVQADAQLRAVRDLRVLAGRGCAGRTVELRYHR